MPCKPSFEKQFGILETYGVNLAQILLIIRSFVDKSTASEYFDVVTQPLYQGIVHTTYHIHFVTYATVAPYNFGEGVTEPFRKTLGQRRKLYDVHEIAVAAGAVAQPFGSETEVRINRFDVIAYLLQCFSLITPGENVRNGILAGKIPVREFLRHSKLVVKNTVCAKLNGPVGPFEQLVSPYTSAHVCNHECAGIVVPKSRSLSREFVMLSEFISGVVVIAYLGSLTRLVEPAFVVDETPVVIQDQMPSLRLVLCNPLFPRSIPALTFVRSVIRVSIVHPLFPPAEGEHSIGTGHLSCLEYTPGEIFIMAQILSVLMLENDPLPAGHILNPLWNGFLVPPTVSPIAVNAGSLRPVSFVRDDHGRIVGPGIAAEGIWITVESCFHPCEIALGAHLSFRRIGPEPMPGLLE